jgi:hypothetical protein
MLIPTVGSDASGETRSRFPVTGVVIGSLAILALLVIGAVCLCKQVLQAGKRGTGEVPTVCSTWRTRAAALRSRKSGRHSD